MGSTLEKTAQRSGRPAGILSKNCQAARFLKGGRLHARGNLQAGAIRPSTAGARHDQRSSSRKKVLELIQTGSQLRLGHRSSAGGLCRVQQVCPAFRQSSCPPAANRSSRPEAARGRATSLAKVCRRTDIRSDGATHVHPVEPPPAVSGIRFGSAALQLSDGARHIARPVGSRNASTCCLLERLTGSAHALVHPLGQPLQGCPAVGQPGPPHQALCGQQWRELLQQERQPKVGCSLNHDRRTRTPSRGAPEAGAWLN